MASLIQDPSFDLFSFIPNLLWDIIKDMRQEGEVIVDGVTVMKDGKLLFDEI